MSDPSGNTTGLGPRGSEQRNSGTRGAEQPHEEAFEWAIIVSSQMNSPLGIGQQTPAPFPFEHDSCVAPCADST